MTRDEKKDRLESIRKSKEQITKDFHTCPIYMKRVYLEQMTEMIKREHELERAIVK